MKRIASWLVVPVILLVGGCTPAGVREPVDAGVAADDASTLSTDGLGTLPPVETAGQPMPDIAAIRGDGTVVRVHDGDAVVDEPDDGARPGLVGLDGQTLIEASAAADDDDATDVGWMNVFTGEPTGRTRIGGADLAATVTNGTGRYVALVSEPAEQLDGAIAPGRASSTIVIADREVGERYRTTLAGNFHPEAFGTSVGPDGVPDTVYLLEYLPADSPTHYRVRVLHTSTGEVGLPVNLRDKASAVDATMAGYSRTQVVSGHDGGLLFTLYRGVAGEGDRHGYAFVHTLGLAGGVWCLDIAPAMELDTLEGALVVAGDRLVVASANGTVGSYDIAAVLDPTREPVMDVVTQYLHRRGEPVLAATDDRVWVAWGTFVYELDPATLEMVGSAARQLAQPVTALAATTDGLLMAHADGTIESDGGASIDTESRTNDIDDDIVALLVDDAATP